MAAHLETDLETAWLFCSTSPRSTLWPNSLAHSSDGPGATARHPCSDNLLASIMCGICLPACLPHSPAKACVARVCGRTRTICHVNTQAHARMHACEPARMQLAYVVRKESVKLAHEPHGNAGQKRAALQVPGPTPPVHGPNGAAAAATLRLWIHCKVHDRRLSFKRAFRTCQQP